MRENGLQSTLLSKFNCLATIGYWKCYGYLLWLEFSLLLGASTGNLSSRFFVPFSGGSWPWPHPLISELQWSGLSNQQMLLLTENCLQYQKWCPKRGKEWFLCLFVLTRWEIIQPVPTRAFLQPAKAATMCTACCDYACPPPPIPSYLVVQNLSLKWILPTDNKVKLRQKASLVVKGLLREKFYPRMIWRED